MAVAIVSIVCGQNRAVGNLIMREDVQRILEKYILNIKRLDNQIKKVYTLAMK